MIDDQSVAIFLDSIIDALEAAASCMSGSTRTEHTSLCPGGVVEDPRKLEPQPNTPNYTLESLVHLSLLWSCPHRGKVYWCPLCTSCILSAFLASLPHPVVVHSASKANCLSSQSATLRYAKSRSVGWYSSPND